MDLNGLFSYSPLSSSIQLQKKKKKGGERRAMLYISARNVLSYQHKLGKALTVFQDKCREHAHKAFSVEHTHTHTRT